MLLECSREMLWGFISRWGPRWRAADWCISALAVPLKATVLMWDSGAPLMGTVRQGAALLGWEQNHWDGSSSVPGHAPLTCMWNGGTGGALCHPMSGDGMWDTKEHCTQGCSTQNFTAVLGPFRPILSPGAPSAVWGGSQPPVLSQPPMLGSSWGHPVLAVCRRAWLDPCLQRGQGRGRVPGPCAR